MISMIFEGLSLKQIKKNFFGRWESDFNLVGHILLIQITGPLNFFSTNSFILIESLRIFIAASKPAIKCLKLTLETLEQGVKYVQS